jgi:hypothetical protein
MPAAAASSGALLVADEIQREGEVVNVLAEAFAPLADSLSRADSG